MTTWKGRARLGVFALLSTITLTGTLAACGDGASTTDAGASGEDSETQAHSSPLDQYLGDSPFSSAGGGAVTMTRVGPADEESRQKTRQVEDEIAACMEAEGFEYVPNVPDDDAAATFEEANELPPDEYARQYGYGISTMGMLTGDDEESDDPNAAIREELSESAREAYDHALWGDMGGGMVVTESSENDGGAEVNESPDAGDLGCTQKSHDKVFGPVEDQMPNFSEFDDLFRDLGTLEERITSDPDMVSAVDAWTDCMAAAGYSGQDSLDAPRTSIMERMSQLLEVPAPGGDDDAPEGNDEAAESSASMARPIEPADVDEEALGELRDDEIATAVADRECRAEHVDAVEHEVRGAMEQEFVEANRDILERYRDAMAGAQQ